MEDNTFTYQMLDRLRQDSEYYLHWGNGNEKALWALNVESQITKMYELWDSLPEDGKPEWLTRDEISQYADKMKNYVKR